MHFFCKLLRRTHIASSLHEIRFHEELGQTLMKKTFLNNSDYLRNNSRLKKVPSILGATGRICRMRAEITSSAQRPFFAKKLFAGTKTPRNHLKKLRVGFDTYDPVSKDLSPRTPFRIITSVTPH